MTTTIKLPALVAGRFMSIAFNKVDSCLFFIDEEIEAQSNFLKVTQFIGRDETV